MLFTWAVDFGVLGIRFGRICLPALYFHSAAGLTCFALLSISGSLENPDTCFSSAACFGEPVQKACEHPIPFGEM